MSEKRKATNLSVILIAGNEEHNIRACLESVSWAGEIIVLHSGRADNTAAIAGEFTDQVIFREFDGYASQKQAALDKATLSWVLSIDADERVTSQLQEEILSTIASTDTAEGYRIPRRNFFHGKWIRHGGWYPDRQLRLFRRNRVSITDRLVHESFLIEGSCERLHSPLLHFTLPSIRHMLGKNLDYSLFEAREKQNRRRITVFDFIIRPPYEFFRKYLLARGFLDGWEGLVIAVIHTLNKVQVLLYLWELQRLRQDDRQSDDKTSHI